MKKLIAEFFRRGLIAWGFGPVVLAVVYLVLQCGEAVQTVTVEELCTGIFSLSALAFLVGGMNVVYRIEKLPLMAAMLIHGVVLYLGYLATYLVNGWLKQGMLPLLVFSGIFAVGYLVIWACIYCTVRKSTARVNALLKQKQQASDAAPKEDGN